MQTRLSASILLKSAITSEFKHNLLFRGRLKTRRGSDLHLILNVVVCAYQLLADMLVAQFRSTEQGFLLDDSDTFEDRTWVDVVQFKVTTVNSSKFFGDHLS